MIVTARDWVLLMLLIITIVLTGLSLDKQSQRIDSLEFRMEELMKKFAFEQQGAKKTAVALLYGEARLQESSYSDEIMEATAILCVVRNRANTWKKYSHIKSIEERYLTVMLDTLQFSVFNENDPNSDISFEYIMGNEDTARYQMYMGLVESILYGSYPDVTQGADHYVASWLYKKKNGWWRRMSTKLIAGGHRFLA